jgi:hypothetical protein
MHCLVAEQEGRQIGTRLGTGVRNPSYRQAALSIAAFHSFHHKTPLKFVALVRTSRARELRAELSVSSVNASKLNWCCYRIHFGAFLPLSSAVELARKFRSLVLAYTNDFKTVSYFPLWSSGQSSRLQIQRSGFVSRRYQIF